MEPKHFSHFLFAQQLNYNIILDIGLLSLIIHAESYHYSHHHTIDLFYILEHIHKALRIDCEVKWISASIRYIPLLSSTCRKQRRPFRWRASCRIGERVQRLENSIQTKSTVRSLLHSTTITSMDQRNLGKTLKCPCKQRDHGPLKKAVHSVRVSWENQF